MLWIRGADDALVFDTSILDFGYLGRIGVVPGWPGEEAYVQNGGSYREAMIEDCGPSPHVEKPEEFQRVLLGFLKEHS